MMIIKAWLDSNAEEVMEIPDEEVEGMDEDQQRNYIYQAYLDHWADQRTHYGFNVIEKPVSKHGVG